MLQQFLQDQRGLEAMEIAAIAAGLLVLAFAAYRFFGNTLGEYVRNLPGLLGFGG